MKKRLAIMAILTLIFVSCSNDDGLLKPTQPLKDTPVRVNVSVADLQTRAGYDNSNLPDRFYMNITHPDEGSKYTYDVIMKKNEEGKWASYDLDNRTDPVLMLWAGDNKNVSVTATTFYIFKNRGNMGGDMGYVEVDTDQSTEDKIKSSDHLLMQAPNVVPSASGIDITFSHLLAKVKLSIELKDEFDASQNPFTNVSIDGTFPQRQYNFTTATEGESPWTDLTWIPATPIAPLLNSFTPAEDSNRARGEFEAILVPQNVEANKFIVRFKVGEREFKWVYAQPISLESGTVYTLKLIAGHDKVSSTSFLASAWNTEESTIKGETE